MAKKQVNFKLPQDLIEALDAKAVQENTNRTELVIQGIRCILGLSEVQGNSVDSDIYRRIEEAESRLHQLETHRVDSSADDYRIDRLENKVSQLESQRIEDDIHNRVHELAEQLKKLSNRLTQIERQKEFTIGTNRSNNQGIPEPNNSNQESLALTELAKRLGVDRSNLAKARKNKSAQEFESYTKIRDPDGKKWRFDETRNLFILQN